MQRQMDVNAVESLFQTDKSKSTKAESVNRQYSGETQTGYHNININHIKYMLVQQYYYY